jgi:hypothetical protein
MTEKKSNNTKCKPRIEIKLEKKLVAYMMGAGAAAAWLSTTEPAEAKVVYTRANLRSPHIVVLDLNHDGIADFSIGFLGRHYYPYFGVLPDVPGNTVQYSPEFVGFRGNVVGPGGSFQTGGFYTGYTAVLAVSRYPYLSGVWVNVTNRYLGLKFLINGQVHYGWARMTLSSGNPILVVTGYAYETVPNKQIVEGATGDTAELDVPDLWERSRPAGPSLGMLARGIEGLAFWRRDYTPVAYKRSDEIA